MKNCENGVTGNTTLFHSVVGGSSPTFSLKKLRIVECKFSDIRPIFEQWHYKKGHMGGGISHCLALIDTFSNIVGGVVIGKLRHEKKYSKGGERVVELRRMACLEEMPKNTESYFLGKVHWWLKKNTDFDKIISYSDLSVGHKGTIYRASGYTKIGTTSPSKHIFWKGERYHPRSLTIDRPYSYELRKAVRNGEAIIETGKPKLIFEKKLPTETKS